MVKVTYIDTKGVERTVDAEPGVSVMQAGLDNNIPQIESDCGGVCACAACHVYVEPQWLDRLTPMNKTENGLLGLLDVRKPNSRFSCQLKLTEALDGLTVHTLDPVAE